jgi:hypothetical protein
MENLFFFLRKKIDEKIIVLSKQNKNHKWWKCIFIGQNFFLPDNLDGYSSYRYLF